MSDYVLFQMREPIRQNLIKIHYFYVDQARKRLLSQFENIEAEADSAAEEWLEQHNHFFDPDRHDPADFYGRAFDASAEFYRLLSDMRDQTRLSVTAGMFHEWDKQLRDWLVREMHNWHCRDGNASKKIWSAEFKEIIDLMESFGWQIRNQDYYEKLDACRLVVNVYKHGSGRSLEELKQNYPEYLDHPFSGVDDIISNMKYSDHTDLKVSEDQFQAFADAIAMFWQDVPENIFESQINKWPDWLNKAISKDRGGQ